MISLLKTMTSQRRQIRGVKLMSEVKNSPHHQATDVIRASHEAEIHVPEGAGSDKSGRSPIGEKGREGMRSEFAPCFLYFSE